MTLVERKKDIAWNKIYQHFPCVTPSDEVNLHCIFYMRYHQEMTNAIFRKIKMQLSANVIQCLPNFLMLSYTLHPSIYKEKLE